MYGLREGLIAADMLDVLIKKHPAILDPEQEGDVSKLLDDLTKMLATWLEVRKG